MARLLTEIERAKAVAFDRAEDALAAELPACARPTLDPDARAALGGFVDWCAAVGVRHCPAKPSTVAAWVFQARPDAVLQTVHAIASLHDFYFKPNPTAAAQVRAALEDKLKIEPPRSWTKNEKVSFAQLPSDVRAAISRREQQRDRELRRLQNETAELRKIGDAVKVAEKDGEDTMPKREGWQKGEGPYSKSSDLKLDRQEDTRKPRDISQAVDGNANANDGAPAPVTVPK